MNPTRLLPTNRVDEAAARDAYRRRRFLAIGASVGATALAGCSSDTVPGGSDGDGDPDGSDGDDTESPASDSGSGTFRLLISDQPVAIDDFDELNVSFDHARVFRGGDDDDDDAEATATASPTPTATASPTPTETETGTETATTTPNATDTATQDAEENAPDEEAEANDGEGEEDGDEGDGEGQRGFFIIDLDGATVDLTQVVGDKAIGVFEGELEEGRYTKVELHVSDVEGIVDGDSATVKVPSEKLQIVKPFEVVASETLSFVFDINVVKKGKTGGYNLLPVVSESGVAGEDVEVDEVDEDGEAQEPEDDETEETETDETEETETDETEATETDEPEDGAGGGNGDNGGGPPDEDDDS